MKLKNKKTGEIWYIGRVLTNDYPSYETLKQINAEWEDYEEPKEYWYIADNGEIENDTDDGVDYEERMKEIGNYFETKEEAEKAVEKLKAWKRLKDKGFRFALLEYTLNDPVNEGSGSVRFGFSCCENCNKDLDLLFSGEDD